MSKNLTIKTLFFIFTILIFSGCEPDVPKDHYSLKECQEELLEATDYAEDGGIDRIVVIKKERKMYLYKNGTIQQTIPVSLGKNPVGQKEQKGD
ncbi:MAG TPA: murein L,D-transpeptidase, partial [Epsilonproteobacteria bacterium]|nr:murein L,D-transpeptidase [Campylobacterota bacterium]